MAQKRKVDRIKHKSNRAESKRRLEHIEMDVAFLRDSITDLLSEMRSVRNSLPDLLPALEEKPQCEVSPTFPRMIFRSRVTSQLPYTPCCTLVKLT